MLLDLSNLYTRPHDSMQIGGGDNASFATWFDGEYCSYKGVPFKAKCSGNDIVVSPNNTQNHFTWLTAMWKKEYRTIREPLSFL